MTSTDFDEVVEHRIERIKTILSSKAEEYAKGGDRLHNFNLAAQITGKTREEVLWGMAMKHLVSIIDIVEGTQYGIYPTKEIAEEKIGDMVSYLILLEASLNNKRNNKT